MLAAMVEGGGEGEGEGADGGAGEAEGDAWHALGVALLGMERWGAARAVWRRGAALAPSHELLRSQVARDRAYLPQASPPQQAPAEVAGGPDARFLLGPSGRPPPAAPPAAPPAYDAYVLRGEARAFCTRAPLLSVHECAAAVAAAEAHAVAHGGWTTSRHYAVPTTDLPVHAVPRAGCKRRLPCLSTAPHLPA